MPESAQVTIERPVTVTRQVTITLEPVLCIRGAGQAANCAIIIEPWGARTIESYTPDEDAEKIYHLLLDQLPGGTFNSLRQAFKRELVG